MQFLQFERMKPTNRKNAPKGRAPFSSVAVLLTLLMGQQAALAANDIYKTVDDDGNTVFTDKPEGSSITITAPEPNVVTTTTAAYSQDINDDDYDELELEPAEPRPLTVSSVEINSPLHQQTLINPRGSFLVGLDVGPENGMPEGFTAEVKLDGRVVSSGVGTLLAVPVPDRGTHSIEALILDADGNVQASSQPVTIHIMKSFVRREE